MKKFYSLAILALASISAFAQVSLTHENYYVPGQTVNDLYIVENTASDSVLLTTILNNPLNFSSNLEGAFATYDMIDTTIYATPANSADFPSETVSFSDENGMIMHIKVDEERATCLGISGALAQIGLNDNINIVFDHPMDVNEFPSTLNAEKHSTAQGKYLENVSALQSIFDSFGSYGPLFYQILSAEYDSIKVEISVDYTNRFDEAGSLTLSGQRMKQGTYEYLREFRQYSYITNMFLHRIGSNEFTNINECTVTNEMLGMFLGTPTINIGEMLQNYMGLSFPMSNTSTKLNYWIADDNYPIVEMNVNTSLTAATSLLVRYGENTTCAENEAVRLEIYPNPTSDNLNITIDNAGSSKMRIYSTTGALVQEAKLDGNCNSVNVSNLSTGTYFYEISLGEKKLNGKFAKQ